jgi:antitoxin ParD1/3/4
MFIFIKYRHNMNVSLTKKQEAYIADQIESGDYQNASELVRDALRLHQVYREKVIRDLRREIEIGRNSGRSDRTIQDIIASRK